MKAPHPFISFFKFLNSIDPVEQNSINAYYFREMFLMFTSKMQIFTRYGSTSKVLLQHDHPALCKNGLLNNILDVIRRGNWSIFPEMSHFSLREKEEKETF